MATRRYSFRKVKRHRSYTVHEAGDAAEVVPETVRRWMKEGLPYLSDRRPSLILGEDLIEFLRNRRPEKRRCAIHQCYCFRCRAPRAAAGGMAEFVPTSAQSGNLCALCETCSAVMHKQLSRARLPELCEILDVTIKEADTPTN